MRTPVANPLVLFAFVAGLALFATACGDDAGEDDEPTEPYALTLGTWDNEAATFAELAEGEVVEMVVGFQGLVFANLALMTWDDVPVRQVAEAEVELVGHGLTYPFVDNQLFFEEVGEGALVVPSFRVPFELPETELEGETVRLTVVVAADGREARIEAEFVIRDDEDCFHTPWDEIVCE